jgi:carbon-monoxide dehydrogenase large subunit
VFGARQLRIEDPPLLRGEGRYVADLDLPDCLVVAYLTSPVPRAEIRSLDVSAAKASSGVVDLVTAADIDIGPYPLLDSSWPPAMARPLLAAGAVRFVGEAVAAVVAEDLESALDAVDRIEVDYHEQRAVIDPIEALEGSDLVHRDAQTNKVSEAHGGSEEEAEESEVEIRAVFHSSRVAPCPLETRAGASRWEPDGRLTHWSSCQGAHAVRGLLCQVHGLRADGVRVIVPEVGGSFGAKARPFPEEVLLPWLARRVARPVRWVPSRSQDMVGLGHSRAQIQEVRLGGRRDGTIESFRVRVIADCGAYPMNAPLLARNTGVLAGGAYRVPTVSWEAVSVVTNTTPTSSYRGAGRPEAAALLERTVDLFADRLGMDAAEVRRRNLIPSSSFPYRAPTGLVHDSGEYAQALDAALDNVGYHSLREEQERRRKNGINPALGIGIATFVDRTAGVPGTEFGAVEITSDGGATVYTGSTPYGQGHRTSWAMLVAERTGIPFDRIEVRYGDTDLVPRSGVTGGSRSVQKAGAAVAEATDELVRLARDAAAELLEAAPVDVVLDTAHGLFHVVGTPSRSLGWSRVAQSVLDNEGAALKCEADVGGDATVPFGAYVAVVEVDVETGMVRLQRIVTVDDAGRILNPLLAEGQVHGGVAQGAGQALYEEFVYDRTGNPLTANLADYPLPSAVEIPDIRSSFLETPSPNNLLGAKGVAESGTIGAPPAIQNAVIDALRHLGVTHIDMPCTPERVWRAITSATTSSSDTAG